MTNDQSTFDFSSIMSISTRLTSSALLLLIAIVALPDGANAQERERGWDYSEQRNWINRQTNKGGEMAVADCFEDTTNRRDVILNGNRITTQILNFGSISAPGNTITDIVWKRYDKGK